MFNWLRTIQQRFGPSEDELRVAKDELIIRANRMGIQYDATDDYATMFASMRRAQAVPYVKAINTSDPNYTQIIPSVVKAQIIGLRSRLATATISAASPDEALDFIWEAHQGDAVCAVEQV